MSYPSDVIQEYLTQTLHEGIPSNTHIISNWMVFGPDGRLTGFQEPLIHMFNKVCSVFRPCLVPGQTYGLID